MRMGKGHLCLLFTALFMILVSLGLIVTSITTDFWYEVDGSGSSDPVVQRNFTSNIGMWRRCYNNGIPAGKCLYRLITGVESNTDYWVSYTVRKYANVCIVYININFYILIDSSGGN